MKYLSILIFLFSLNFANAQDTTNVEVITPKIVTNLANGATFTKDDVSIQFLKVETDSRCPKNVQCIRAGEAKVLVAVFKDGKEVEQKTIIIHPTASFQKQLNLIFSSEEFSISGFNLLPYPNHGTKINAEDYVLQLQVSN